MYTVLLYVFNTTRGLTAQCNMCEHSDSNSVGMGETMVLTVIVILIRKVYTHSKKIVRKNFSNGGRVVGGTIISIMEVYGGEKFWGYR